MAETLTWGMLGTGHIAAQFAEGLNASPRQKLLAVGSRQAGTARAFAERFRIPSAYRSYDAVLKDPSIQAVYNSLPNSLHHEWTVKALRAGKHVLCEKPLASNLAQAEEMFDEAERHGRLLVEAFMYRSHPLTHAVLKAVDEGRIGALKMIRTSFVYAARQIEGNIRFSAPLAGGSLMDIGCYCLSYARLFAGAEPIQMSAYGHVHESGIDDYAAGVLAFPKEIVATFACGMTVCADNTAYLMGTRAYIEIPVPWKPPVVDATYALITADGRREQMRVSANRHLYALEADDFAASVLDGASPAVSKSDSLGNQRCLDTLRRQIGMTV